MGGGANRAGAAMSGGDSRPEPQLRVPPNSAEAEMALLGAVLCDNAQYGRVAHLVDEASFYRHEHRVIWRTIATLVRANRVADVITVHEAGGHDLAEVNALAQSVLAVHRAPAYAELVRESWLLRQVIGVGDDMAGSCYRGDRQAVQVIDGAISRLLSLQQGMRRGEPVSISALLPEVIQYVSDLAEGKTDAVPTGLQAIDDITSGGTRAGELWIIGARPSMGKTAMQLAISRHTAIDHAVLICSMEDSSKMMVMRHIAAAGRVNLSHLRRPGNHTNWRAATEAADELSRLRMYVDDDGGLSLLDVRRKIQQVKHADPGLRVVVVDYLQLMAEEGETRNIGLGRIANGLKAAAKEFGVTVVMLSQLSREADKRNGVPQISDLRDSGDIEGAGDVILLLHREFRRKPEPWLKHWAQVHVAKQKNGPTDIVSLYFDGETQRFADWDGPVPKPGDEYGPA